MATIQPKVSHGCKYWYIVESRRVNGKPRPVVLAYLGKVEDLLKKLQGTSNDHLKLKSYSHGALCALLQIAHQLDIVNEINKHIHSQRTWMAEKPIRNNLTAGITLLLGAIGRVCMPTSKMGWWNWARTTSCEYLLHCNLSKIDSQHFWDLMDALPVTAIPLIEEAVLQRVFQQYQLTTDSLFYDTTNFFTFIDTTNIRCTIAQRGKNKQKRNDLRQIGLALVVTREDFIPLFHLTYQGNIHDSKIFAQVLGAIKERMEKLHLDIEKHTLIFDRGNNSKKNLGAVFSHNIHYIGALTPYHHKQLIEDAVGHYTDVIIDEDRTLQVFRDKRSLWGQERTVLVFVSDALKEGQMRGVVQWIEKRKRRLDKINIELAKPNTKKRSKKRLCTMIHGLVKGPYGNDLLNWSLERTVERRFNIKYSIDDEKLSTIEDSLGFRIIMTDRHNWSSEAIIRAFYGQAFVEYAFRNLKNLYHLAIRPSFHWTDQKLLVHYFMCVQGYLLSTLIYRKARLQCNYKKSIDSLFDTLNNIRLATILELKGKGKVKAHYKLEEMDEEEQLLLNGLGLENYHLEKPRFDGFSVYNQ
jgi:transposase